MDIVFASNNRYSPGLALAVASLLEHTALGCADCIHILDGGLAPTQRRDIEHILLQHRAGISLHFHSIDVGPLQGVRLLQGSPLTYARLLLPDLFPQLSEVIYSDVDILFGTSLVPLWEAEVAGYAVVAVQDSLLKVLANDDPWLESYSDERELPYFNAGLMKINLTYWREHNIGPKAIRVAVEQSDRCQYWDQTILNHLLRKQIVWMDPSLNYLVPEENPIDQGLANNEGKNLHYVCRVKPWMRYSKRVTFAYWRKRFRELISWCPYFSCHWRFWVEYIWADWIVTSRYIRPVSSIILKSGAYRVLPGLTRSKLETHLRELS